MATKPEVKVKDAIKALLTATGAYFFMPVQTGYGKRTLDFIGTSRGRGFLIETKRPRKHPTTLQDITITEARAAGARVFVIDGTNAPGKDTYRDLATWLIGRD
jgi:hypothetical protein